MAAETAAFEQANPRSRELFERAKGSLLDGVPMNWMIRWAGPYPLFVDEATGARFRDVDGHEYVDFCLGDTGAMAGHGPSPTIAAVERQLRRGITHMLPTEDAIVAADELRRRFGLRYWQFTLTATDANRFAIRLARHITGRSKVLVHNHNYHGSVDETFAWIAPDGGVVARRGNLGAPVPPSETTRVVEINDIDALDRELAHGDVAVALMEPALTNVGIVLPDPGYHDAVRELTRKHGTLLIIDETHTICAGPGGYTAAYGLEPDILTIGKTIGGGHPGGCLRVHRGAGRADRREHPRGGRGRRRRRRHAGRQRPVDGGDPGDADRGPDRRGVRSHAAARRAMGRGRRRRHPPATTSRGTSPGSAPAPSTTSCRRRPATAPSSGRTPTPTSSGSCTYGR